VLHTDEERPETWPLQFYEMSRLTAWPDPFLRRVADRLDEVRELTLEVAFARLMVKTEAERRDGGIDTLDVASGGYR